MTRFTYFRTGLALAMLSLGGCASIQPALAVVSAATSSAPLGDRITMDERGMYAVEALYNVPAQAYVTADQHHLVTPALRARVRPLLQRARAAVLACRTAYHVGDATSWGARVSDLQQLKAQVMSLLPASN